MKIGSVRINGQAFLAPMAGVTDMPYRRICKKYGAALVYTEMISAKGLYYNDRKTAELMEIAPDERPCAVQLFGSDPEIIAEVIPKVAETAAPEIIDINMGCPTPKIVNNGDGCALMKNPPLIGKIMRAASDVSPVPVTAKIRKGCDSESAVEAAKILEANGAAAVAVHGRTREDFYSGAADWDVICAVREAVKIPVIGNGDIFTARDAVRMMDHTGCGAVMVGRGAQGNPFIFRQINDLLSGAEPDGEPAAEEKINQALEHLEALVAAHGEYRGVREARKHIAWYIKGLPGAAKIKSRVFISETFSETKAVLSEYATALEEKIRDFPI